MNVWQFSFTQSWWSQERWPLRRPFMTQWSHCSAKSQNKTKQKERQEPLAWKSYNTMRNWLHQDMSIPAERKWLTQYFIKKYLHTGIIVLFFWIRAVLPKLLLYILRISRKLMETQITKNQWLQEFSENFMHVTQA